MTSPALQTALAYHRAWTSKDLDAAMRYIADDVVCDAPAGRIDGIGGTGISWHLSPRGSSSEPR